MKRLEDIPKKTLFEVPEGYFEKLPGVIQARVAVREEQSVWSPFLSYGLKVALPIVVLVVAALFFWPNSAAKTPEQMLASIESEQLVAYLRETDLNADDFLDAVPLDQFEVDALQENAINEMNFNDMDLEALANEFVDYN
ncbi:MAG: hypothetical protein SH819_09465 [Cytophagales bacterium]|nr:hypothetical protein [Cytophagales bacterium]